jgi:SAM-dependent methyltransferase
MKMMDGVTLKDVQAVYSGAEGDLWELVMGEQIHIGGFVSSMDLAERAGIKPGSRGTDLCCCTGAGMRFLVRFRDVASMTGVDATQKVVDRGRQRCEAAAFNGKITFILAHVANTGLDTGSMDFVWGEDAWCYVENKAALIAEAARITKPGGTIAFTDWIEGPEGLSDAEAERFLTFMKFPGIEDLGSYQTLLQANGCEILVAQDTGRFAPYVDLYLDMLQKQLTFDALRIIGFDTNLLQYMSGEMTFMQELAHAGKIAQGLFVAKKM